jgi:O-antigen/teichoic acid export membrane protein
MNPESNSLWKKSLFVSLSQLIRLFTNVFIFVGIARLYGPEEYGQFTIAYTLATIFIVVADFGFDVLLTTEVAKHRDDIVNIGRKFFSMKILFTLLSTTLMLLIPAFRAFSPGSRNIIFILVLYMIFTTFTNFFNAIFRGYERFEYETKISFITNLILLSLLILLGSLKVELHFLMISFVIARFVGLIISIIFSRKLVGADFLKLDFSEWRIALTSVLIYGIHFLFGNLYFQLDTILIGLIRGDQDAGIYQAAFKIMLMLLLIPEIAISTILPMLTKVFVNNRELWRNIGRLLFKILFFIAIPVAAVLYFYSDKIIQIVFGDKGFNEAIPVLQIFSFVVLLRFSLEPFALMLTTANRQMIRMYVVITATILNLIFNSIVIPYYGIIGAAWVSVGINVLVGLGYIIPNRRFLFEWLKSIKELVFLGLVIFSLLLFDSTIVATVVTLLLYGGLSYFIGFTESERSSIINNLLFRRF